MSSAIASPHNEYSRIEFRMCPCRDQIVRISDAGDFPAEVRILHGVNPFAFAVRNKRTAALRP